MKVIVLVGDSNCGKTAALNRFILEMLQSRGGTIEWIYGRIPQHQVITDINLELTMVGAGKAKHIKDRNIIIRHNDKYIGITTYGDQEKMIKGAYTTLLNNSKFPLDIFICASHPVAGNPIQPFPICDKIANGLVLREYINRNLDRILAKDYYLITPPTSISYAIEKEAAKNIAAYVSQEQAIVDKMLAMIDD